MNKKDIDFELDAMRQEMNRLKDSWRVFRILSEFVVGFETLTHLGPSVSFFGSARLTETSEYFELARTLARRLGEQGFAIVTGGGPGLMEAANKGAKEANTPSCGLCINLPHEDKSNPYIDNSYTLSFRYFFVRKVMFIRYTSALIALPGGFGTLDEVYEALTLIQTKKIRPFPIFLLGVNYWKGLIDWMKSTLITHKTISSHDLDLLKLTDNIDEVVEGIVKHRDATRIMENF